LTYWPFGFVLTVPIGAVVLVVLVLGFLAGLLAHLPGRISAKLRAKRAERRVAELETRTALVVQPEP
jgi:hypothetical protein